MALLHRTAPAALLAAILAAVALPSQASHIALESTRMTGNQAYTGALGMDFDVFAAITITELGAYDSTGNGFAAPVAVGIFNRDTGTLVGTAASLTTANTTTGGTLRNRFFDVADFVLGPGRYSIVADGYSAIEQNGNVGLGGTGPTINTGGGLIGFTGGSRYGAPNTGLIFPGIIDGGPANRYDAGTFRFMAVPEPTSLALAGLALLGLGLMGRRKA